MLPFCIPQPLTFVTVIPVISISSSASFSDSNFELFISITTLRIFPSALYAERSIGFERSICVTLLAFPSDRSEIRSSVTMPCQPCSERSRPIISAFSETLIPTVCLSITKSSVIAANPYTATDKTPISCTPRKLNLPV